MSSDLLASFASFTAGLEPWQQVGALILAGAIPFVESYLGSTIGVILGVNPFLAVAAAVVGNVICTFVLIGLAGGVRGAAMRNREAPVELSGRREKIQRYFNRFGVPGVCLLGPSVLASQITAPTLVALGANKTSVLVWSGVSILAWGVLFGFFSGALFTWVI